MGTRYGRYLLDRRLAIGGMAEVFLGRVEGPAGFEKKVVIKRILPHHCNDQRYIEMFLDEARIAAKFNHPNLVQIHELAKIQGQFCMVMEYIEGKDLENVRDLCSRLHRYIPLPIAAFIIAEAAEGLHYAHEMTAEGGEPLSVVHRDVSPANLIMTWIGGVKVVDFGIAKHSEAQSQTEAGVIKGKFSYLSPEQASGKPIDRRSDIFSLGTVLYELLTLAPCFTQATPFETLDAVASVRYRPASELRPDIPKELEAILETMLQQEPARRHPSAVELSRDLRRFMAQVGVPVANDVQIFLEELFGRNKPVPERSYNPLSSGPEVPVTKEFSNPAVGVPEAARQQMLSQLIEADGPTAPGALSIPEQLSADAEQLLDAPTVRAAAPLLAAKNLSDPSIETVDLGQPSSPQNDPQETWDDETVTTASPNFAATNPPGQEWDAPTEQVDSPFAELGSDDELWGDKTRAEDALWGDNANPEELWDDKTVQQDASMQLPSESAMEDEPRDTTGGPLAPDPFDVADPFSGPSARDPFELSATSVPFEVDSAAGPDDSISILAITAETVSPVLNRPEQTTDKVRSFPSRLGRSLRQLWRNITGKDSDDCVGIEDIGYHTLVDGDDLPRPSSRFSYKFKENRIPLIGGAVALVAVVALAGFILVADDQPAQVAVGPPVIGSLTVQSSPAGATVYVDGLVRGETPLTVDDLAEGGHRVTAALEGYPPATKNVTIGPEMTDAVLTITLSQTGASAQISNAVSPAVEVDSEAAAARDDKPEESTAEPAGNPDEKKPKTSDDEKGNKADGTPSKKVEVAKKADTGKAKRSDDGKSRRHGFLYLSSKPNADVILNGRKIGTTPLKGYRLPPGSHSLQLRKPGMSKTVKVSVRGGDTVKRDVQFGKGKVYVSVSPWAEVYLYGKHMGTTPMPPFSLWEGVHEIKLVNPQLGIERKKRIQVRANETVKVLEKLP